MKHEAPILPQHHKTPISTHHHKNPIIPWGPVAAILMTIVIYFGAQVLASILLVAYGSLRGWNEQTIETWLTTNPAGEFAFVFAVEALTVFFLWRYVRYRKASMRLLGLVRPKLQDIGYAVVGYLAYVPMYFLIVKAVETMIPTINVNQEQQIGFEGVAGGSGLLLVFVALVIMPPIVEEILMRGFLYQGLKTKLPRIFAALVTSVIFAVAHLQFGSGAALLWIAAIDTFILSMVLIKLGEKTGRLWAPIGLHSIKNAVAFYFLFVYKG